MVSLSQMVTGGSSGEGVFKGVTGEAKPVAPAAWEGESFRQKESRNTALTQQRPLSLGTQSQAQAQKGGSPYAGCAH